MSVSQALAHAQRMADAQHKPECRSTFRTRWRAVEEKRPHPDCTGCVTDREREQWRQQADEMQAYLDRNPDDNLLDQTDTEEEDDPQYLADLHADEASNPL